MASDDKRQRVWFKVVKILKKKYKNLGKLLLGGAAFLGSIFINQDSLNAQPLPNPDDIRNRARYI